MNTAHRLLLLDEVAMETRSPLATVRYWIRTGKLPALKPGRRVLVRRADLEAFLANAVRLTELRPLCGGTQEGAGSTPKLEKNDAGQRRT